MHSWAARRPSKRCFYRGSLRFSTLVSLPTALLGSTARYAVLVAACISVLIRSSVLRPERARRKPQINGLFGMTILLGVFLFYHAILFSQVPLVSLLEESISFAIATMTLIAAWNDMSEASRNKTSQFIFGGLCALVVLSLPLVIMPEGYLRNGSGFQGVLKSPSSVWCNARAAWCLARRALIRDPPLAAVGVDHSGRYARFSSSSPRPVRPEPASSSEGYISAGLNRSQTSRCPQSLDAVAH